MNQIAEHDFTTNLFKLLKETFEGPPQEGGSAYLDKGAGLFQTLDAVTAEIASRSASPGAPTIAAHCAHVRYYVEVLGAYLGGQDPKVDWAASWRTPHVGPAEWDALRHNMRSGYEALSQTLLGVRTWNDDPVGDSMAIVVHTAYHLGAIRQVLRVVEA